MAGVYFNGLVENVAASISANQTFIQLIAATNQRVRIKRIGIYGQGTAISDTPVTFEVLKQTTAGTSSSLTLVKQDDNAGETLQTTALKTFTAEPTAGNVKFTANVPSTGRQEWVFPLGFDLFIKGGERLGIRALTAVQASVFTVMIEAEE